MKNYLTFLIIILATAVLFSCKKKCAYEKSGFKLNEQEYSSCTLPWKIGVTTHGISLWNCSPTICSPSCSIRIDSIYSIIALANKQFEICRSESLCNVGKFAFLGVDGLLADTGVVSFDAATTSKISGRFWARCYHVDSGINGVPYQIEEGFFTAQIIE